MTIRFFRRVRLAPGLTLNLSKRGASVSVGPRGAKITAGTSGVRRTIGLPGTGLWYTEHVSSGAKRRRGGASNTEHPPAPRPQDRLNLGFFRRLLIPKAEEHFVDGMRHAALGRPQDALELLRQADGIPDASFMAGMFALKAGLYEEAIAHLERALQARGRLGSHLRRYGVSAAVSLPITPRIQAQIAPAVRGIRLALAEAHQARGAWEPAVEQLERLRSEDPEDPIVLLALVEILVEERGDGDALQEVVRRTRAVSNDSETHAAILLWKGRALRRLGLHTAARDTLTAAFRRKKERSDELLRAIRYERALVYESLNDARRARTELEGIYAETPDYEDVGKRLDLGDTVVAKHESPA